MREILAELKSVRKLLENGFGVEAGAIQQLGVVDNPLAVKRMSISQNNGVMLEEENEGRWSNSPIESICGRIVKLSTRLAEEGEFGPALYGYIEIKADILYSIRFNSERNFGRFLIAQILTASYEQLSGVMTLSITAGTKRKTARFPNLIDSFGFKIEVDPIEKDDWMRNRESYLEQAAARIKAARSSNIPVFGVSSHIAAIAPAQISDTPPSEQSDLVQKVIAEAKAFWGDDFKDKVRAHSATHFGGLFLKDMTIAQLQQYLKDLKAMQ